MEMPGTRVSNDFASAFLTGRGLPDVKPASVLVHNRRDSVMFFAMRDGAPLYLVRLARHPKDNGLVVAEYETLVKLKQRLAGGERLEGSIPAPVRLDYHVGRAFLVTDWFSGRKDLLFGFDRQRCADAVDWLVALHQETGAVSTFGRDLLTQYVGRYSNSPPDAPLPGELRSLFDDTVDSFGALNTEAVPVAFTHNDFSAANILFGDRGRVSVVDWATATEKGFLFLDAFDIALYLVNNALNDYPRSLRRLAGGGGAKEGELRRMCGTYIRGFNLSQGMLHWLLKVFFLSKACRFHWAGRPERVRQLIECFRVSRDIDVRFG